MYRNEFYLTLTEFTSSRNTIVTLQIRAPFVGCIRDVQVLQQETPSEKWLPLEWDNSIERNAATANWEGCPLNLQEGAHFVGTGKSLMFLGEYGAGGCFTISDGPYVRPGNGPFSVSEMWGEMHVLFSISSNLYVIFITIPKGRNALHRL